MRKKVAMILIILSLLFGAMACIKTGGGDGTPVPSSNITATYGAEQFHLQLTCVSGGPCDD